ncbi:MAG TPA: hypothetical protein VHY57_02270 [Rhizomicrobium sp.]|jgi:hypothetical protein|nr:hypothetical protein [Rhizomicrobium sp.]
MTFRIQYLRDGKAAGSSDRASTMYDARRVAHLARDRHGFNLAVILAPVASGGEKEIEVIRFEH